MKKVVKNLFVLFFVLVSLVCITVSTSAVNSDFAGGDGTENNPYLISDKTHLNNVRYYLDAHYKLLCDIEFSEADFTEDGDFYNNGEGFIPIGTQRNAFRGTFDGNGYDVKNLFINVSTTDYEIYVGLFAYNSGTIKNIGIVDGTIFGEVTAPTTCRQCDAFVGGICGFNGSNGIITNCYNSCDISATVPFSSPAKYNHTYAGAIAGYNGKGTIEKCNNIGIVQADADKYDSAGGIVGVSEGGSITNSYSCGQIMGDYAGGIAGKIYNSTCISNCYNIGSVIAYSNSTSRSGGIVGENGISTYGTTVVGDNGDCTIQYCYNNGEVSSTDDAGGIAGCNGNGIIKNCYNLGCVQSENSTGGIVGENVAKIDQCYNIGTVLSDRCVGGIVGMNTPVSTIMNCYNMGSVIADSYYSNRAGGIVGYNSWDCIVANCYNIGNVLGDEFGGIAGYNYYDSAVLKGELRNCYYLDSVTKGVGGGKDTTVKCSDEQLKKETTYEGFNFTTVWCIDSICDYLYPQLVSKYEFPHTPTMAVTENRVEPQCNINGSYEVVIYCLICNIELSRTEKEIPALEHNWNTGIINPISTCKTHGTKTYTCLNNASHQYTEQVALDGNNHEGGTYLKDVAEATCTENGYTGDTYCSDCNVKLSSGETIPATNHANKITDNVTEATCTKTGYTAGVYCPDCETWLEGHKIINKLSHSFTTYVSDNNATCTADGTKTAKCDNCNATDTLSENGSATGHKEAALNAVAATCTSTGLTEGKKCTTCGEIIVAQQTIPALGHSYNDNFDTTCNTCGEVREVEDYLPGDINNDGVVNNKDLTRLHKYLAGIDVEVVEAALDINGDGLHNAADLIRFMKHLAGENIDDWFDNPGNNDEGDDDSTGDSGDNEVGDGWEDGTELQLHPSQSLPYSANGVTINDITITKEHYDGYRENNYGRPVRQSYRYKIVIQGTTTLDLDEFLISSSFQYYSTTNNAIESNRYYLLRNESECNVEGKMTYNDDGSFYYECYQYHIFEDFDSYYIAVVGGDYIRR